MNENLIRAFISHDLCQQPVSKVPYLLNFQQAWGSVLVVVGTTRIGLPSHCLVKGFKIPFWKKPTTADHYNDLKSDWDLPEKTLPELVRMQIKGLCKFLR